MHPVAYVLTQKITQKIHETAAKQAEQSRASQVDDGIARPISVYGWVFWGCIVIGAIFGGAACLAGQPTIGLVLFGFFALISVPGLCVQYNCRVLYDAQGFTWRNVLRVSRRYSYEDVTGMYSSPTHIVVELNHKKRLDLGYDWMNQHRFADAIVKYRSKKPPKLPLPVLGMSEEEIEASYNGGVISRALLVKAQDLPKFVWFKCVHYGICTLAVFFALFAVLVFPVFQEADTLSGLLFLAVPGLICHIAALLLYFGYPQYFTARERPTNVELSKEKKSSHKRCTLAITSTLCVLDGIVFFLAQMDQYSGPIPIVLAAVAAVLLFFVLLALFRRFSWEYHNFGVGYVTFGFWQGCFCFAIFLLLAGAFLA